MKIKQYKGLKAVKRVAQVTDAHVMQELENIRRQRTQSVPVEDRPAREGDEVIIDYAGFVGDWQFPGGTAEQQPLTLGSGTFIPGFEEQLVGANIGDRVDVNVTFPEVYHSADLAGKEAVFKCTVHGINEKKEMELNDEFARMFAGVKDLEDMKAQMMEYAQQMARDQVRDDLLKALVEQVEEFAPAEELVDAEIRVTLDGFIQQLQQQGMEYGNWLKLTGRTQEQVQEELHPQAIATLKARMALEEICRLENITVSDEEIDKAYAEVSQRYGLSVEQLKATFGTGNDEKLRKDICMKKAIAFLEANAQITEE